MSSSKVANGSDVPAYKMFINNEFVDAVEGKTREIRDPATGELLGIVPEGTAADAKMAISSARKAFDEGPWTSVTAQERGRILLRIAKWITDNTDMLAVLEVKQMGKPLLEAQYDIADSATCFEYYAGLATKIAGETVSVPADVLSMSIREPVGVAAQICPWNYPLLMTVWKLAPAIAAGCTVVLKPSEMTPLTTLELAKCFVDVGLPAGVVNIITGPGQGCGEEMASSPLVDKVAFTGGTVTGRKIMQLACGNLKKVSLELGGKNPLIIFGDSDLEAAVDGALFAAFVNQGEVCSAGSRILVERSIHKRFIDRLLEKTRLIKLGHGLKEGVKMGPLISSQHRDKVMDYIRIGVEEGAKLIAGGKAPQDEDLKHGFFVEPTIFDECHNGMRICREEIFGPVCAIIPFDGEEEAVRISNDTEYGLAAGVFSVDVTKALRVCKKIRAGIQWINSYNFTYCEAPWGGYKMSGLGGRELGLHGIEPYLEHKQINIDLSSKPIGWY